MSDRIDWQTLCKPTPIPRHAAPVDLQKLRNTAPIPTNLGGIERQVFHETIGAVLGICFASVAIGAFVIIGTILLIRVLAWLL